MKRWLPNLQSAMVNRLKQFSHHFQLLSEGIRGQNERNEIADDERQQTEYKISDDLVGAVIIHLVDKAS
jgi:hypothetical protein